MKPVTPDIEFYVASTQLHGGHTHSISVIYKKHLPVPNLIYMH